MTTKIISHEAKVKEIIDLYREGVEAWTKAGEILVELVDEDPQTYDYIIQQEPRINTGVLSKLEQIGRKTLHPQLLMTSSPGYHKLKRLPFSLQERYTKERIPLLVHTESGTDVMLVDAKDMTKEQAAQVFDRDRVRTQSEQKAWLMQHESNERKKHKPNPARAWRIKGRKVEFCEGATLTSKEIATILAQIS